MRFLDTGWYDGSAQTCLSHIQLLYSEWSYSPHFLALIPAITSDSRYELALRLLTRIYRVGNCAITLNVSTTSSTSCRCWLINLISTLMVTVPMYTRYGSQLIVQTSGHSVSLGEYQCSTFSVGYQITFFDIGVRLLDHDLGRSTLLWAHMSIHCLSVRSNPQVAFLFHGRWGMIKFLYLACRYLLFVFVTLGMLSASNV